MDAYQFLWLVFAVVWLLAALTAKRAVRRQSNASRFLQGAVVILGFLLVLQPWRVEAMNIRFIPVSEAATVFGIAFTVTGIAFAFWARLTIGRNWSGAVTLK